VQCIVSGKAVCCKQNTYLALVLFVQQHVARRKAEYSLKKIVPFFMRTVYCGREANVMLALKSTMLLVKYNKLT
jgi:hypothetical protein